MKHGVRGFALADAVAGTVVLGVLGVIALAVPPGWHSGGQASGPYKLGKFGEVGAMYQNDNHGYLPIVLTYRRGFASTGTSGSLQGWTTWSAGGKNNNGWWAGSGGGAFDVEAVDRPLTQYLYPGVFTAPPPPATLPANSPERARQADIWRDAGDRWTYQRTWPVRNTTISCYDDVGTSYHWSSGWYTQVARALNLQLADAFNNGTQRMAQGNGVTPSRFVWYTDQHMDVIINSSSAGFQLTNGYGDVNKSAMLFMDGHAGYQNVIPGNRKASYANAEYSAIFDNLPNPGF